MEEHEPTRSLKFTVSERAASRLEAMAEQKGVSVGELFRRALATQVIVDQLIEHGVLFVQSPDGGLEPFEAN